MNIVAEPNTPEWDGKRKGGIGASESAAAAGVSEYCTPRELYHRKRGELPEREQNDAMRRGMLLEPIIVQEFQRVTGLQVQQYPCGLVVHPEHPRVLATPDAEVSDRSGLECKSTSWRMATRLGGEGSEDLPNDWLCQCQQQMACCGWERVHVAVWIDVHTLRTFVVERNDAAIELLIKADLELWARIEAGDPPPYEWNAGSLDLVKAIYRDVHSDQLIEVDDRCADLWRRQQEFRKEAQRLSDRADAMRAEVLAELGNAQYGVLPGATKMIRRAVISKDAYTVYPKPYVDVREVNVTKPVARLLAAKERENGEATDIADTAAIEAAAD